MQEDPNTPPLSSLVPTVDVTITMTSDALREAQAMQLATPEWQGKALRLYLQGKGCDGFYYGVSFDDVHPGDHHFPQQEGGGLEVVVDSDSLEFVAGSCLTWVDDERGRGFLVDNPHHKKFRGKFYKRKAWQEKFQRHDAAQAQAEEEESLMPPPH